MNEQVDANQPLVDEKTKVIQEAMKSLFLHGNELCNRFADDLTLMQTIEVLFRIAKGRAAMLYTIHDETPYDGVEKDENFKNVIEEFTQCLLADFAQIWDNHRKNSVEIKKRFCVVPQAQTDSTEPKVS